MTNSKTNLAEGLNAVAQINTLQDEIERAHQLLDEVGVGHPEWDLSGRVVLMSFWMKNTPANARLLASPWGIILRFDLGKFGDSIRLQIRC